MFAPLLFASTNHNAWNYHISIGTQRLYKSVDTLYCAEDVEMPRNDLKVERYEDVVKIIRTKSRLLLTFHLVQARQEVAFLKQAPTCCLQMGCQ